MDQYNKTMQPRHARDQAGGVSKTFVDVIARQHKDSRVSVACMFIQGAYELKINPPQNKRNRPKRT